MYEYYTLRGVIKKASLVKQQNKTPSVPLQFVRTENQQLRRPLSRLTSKLTRPIEPAPFPVDASKNENSQKKKKKKKETSIEVRTSPEIKRTRRSRVHVRDGDGWTIFK